MDSQLGKKAAGDRGERDMNVIERFSPNPDRDQQLEPPLPGRIWALLKRVLKLIGMCLSLLSGHFELAFGRVEFLTFNVHTSSDAVTLSENNAP
eukprot:1155945-Pelagomonas_calceolata.AAC.2